MAATTYSLQLAIKLNKAVITNAGLDNGKIILSKLLDNDDLNSLGIHENMSINIKLLAEICETAGAPGYEQRIREIVIREVEPFVDELRTDNMGNLTAVVKGKKDKKVMIGAHMDEIGFIVTHIDDNGFVYFHTLGGFDPKTLTAQRVIIHGNKDIMGVMGSKPIHLMNATDRAKTPTIKDYFIDTGMSRKELEKIVTIGDTITRERELVCLQKI